MKRRSFGKWLLGLVGVAAIPAKSIAAAPELQELEVSPEQEPVEFLSEAWIAQDRDEPQSWMPWPGGEFRLHEQYPQGVPERVQSLGRPVVETDEGLYILSAVRFDNGDVWDVVQGWTPFK